MKKQWLFCLSMFGLLSCGGSKEALEVTVNNPSALARTTEMVELSMNRVAADLHLADTARLVVMDDKGNQLPYQITHDQKLIFPVALGAMETRNFTVQTGTPVDVPVAATGRVYPNRFDDLAWENDLVAFRAYGPALQDKGERGFGYDLFCKRDTDEPMLEDMYDAETNPEYKVKYQELLKTDKEAAQEWRKFMSYHIDSGHGMDCYAVGATLGAGVAALYVGDSIVYPWCYKEVEILDNGPLRFTARLTFRPQTVANDTAVVETRIITLDRGSHFNRTEVSYSGMSEDADICAGVVLHDETPVLADAEAGYVGYADPTVGPDNGQIYLGCVFPTLIKDAKAVYFDEAERKVRSNALGQVVAFAPYEAGSTFTYYWGFGWNRADIADYAVWTDYLKNFAAQVRHPLEVTVK